GGPIEGQAGQNGKEDQEGLLRQLRAGEEDGRQRPQRGERGARGVGSTQARGTNARIELAEEIARGSREGGQGASLNGAGTHQVPVRERRDDGDGHPGRGHGMRAGESDRSGPYRGELQLLLLLQGTLVLGSRLLTDRHPTSGLDPSPDP